MQWIRIRNAAVDIKIELSEEHIIKTIIDRRLWNYIPPRQSCFHNDKEILLKSCIYKSQMLSSQITTAVVAAIQFVFPYIEVESSDD